MPVWRLGVARTRPLIRNAAGTNWTDCNVWRRNAAGTGWNIVSRGLPTLTSTGSGLASVFVTEPAAPNRSVSNGGVAVQTNGGYGPFSYTWTRISGSAAMTITSNASTAQPTFTATVPKNTSVVATWRCSVYDAMTGRTETIDRTIELQYNTSL